MENKFMTLAYKEAIKAYNLGEVPIGCVIVQNNKVIARAHNMREINEDSLGHAEILAIKKANKKLKSWRLDDCEMYVTLEPCLMCAGAIVNSRIKEVYIAKEDKRNGAVLNNVDSFNLFTHKPQTKFLKIDKYDNIISDFFKDLRLNITLDNCYLQTDRLILRPCEESDLLDFYEYAKVDGVGEMAGWKHHKDINETKEILANFIKNKNVLAIIYKENNKVIGSIGIHKNYEYIFRGLKQREIGYVLAKDYWGNGLMTEALNTFITYLFKIVHLDVITVGHFIDNTRSQRVIEKLRFIYYKTKIAYHKKSKYYYLTRSDFII